MDEHQRRVVGSTLRELDAYEAASISLERLVANLQGLLGAADFKDTGLINEFWNQEAPIDGELELRIEGWAPPGGCD